MCEAARRREVAVVNNVKNGLRGAESYLKQCIH